MNRRILITGIQGFVGSNFTKSWKNKFVLFGLDINQKPKEGIKDFFSWDSLDKIPKNDVIIHLAGKAHDTKNQSEAQVYFDINTGLTQKIFDFFLQSSTKKFIYFSSVKAAADRVEGEILTEDVVPQPVGPYGESKIKAEAYIISKKDEYERLGKKVYIIRPCMIHGPGNKGNLNLLYSIVKKNIPWPLGVYDNKRSFCSIDNMTYVVEQLIVKDVSSGIYHVCDDKPVSTNELIEIINESLNKKSRIFNLPKAFINGLAKMGDILHLPLNSQRLQKLTENYVVSNNKIKLALGINKLPLSAKEGLQKTIESFK